ncbi:MAG: glycine oxidase ThiO [Gemmatimonadetes bacterium]|nr:MAG: glycine oxidase ThiO [Gemmatimonadota bacterium]
MATAPDVVVVGGGVVGAACARQLAQGGRRVRLVERGGQSGEAWRASAGMLAPQIEVRANDKLFDLGIAGREFYHDHAAELREATGVDIGLRETGILQVAGSDAEAVTLKDRVAWQRQSGHRCEWLDPGEIRAEWPWLALTHGGMVAPRDGCLDPARLVDALRADATRRGVELVSDTITGLTRSGDRVTGVQGGQWHPAEHVVLAAGAWTGRIANLPRPVSVEPVRGQLAALPWPAGSPPAIVFGCGGYLMHRDGEGIAGSTMEHAGFAAEVTEAGLAAIRARVDALVPSLAGAPVLRAWAGLRPGTPDGRPIVGREPDLAGLWYATGHGRNGVLLAGITGVIVAQFLAGEGTLEGVEELRPERFWSW